MIRFKCPHCGKEFSGANELAGQQASCRKCGNLFTISGAPPILAELVSNPAVQPAPGFQRQTAAPTAPDGGLGPWPPPAAQLLEHQNALTLDNSARASNPGNLRVNRLRWLRHYPRWPLIWFSSLAFFVVLAYSFHWSFWIFAVLLLLMNWLYWRRISDQFRYGCANPAMIVSLDPMLIAVSTDLTKGFGKYPVIKIIEKNLPTACGQLARLGSMLPAVALYHQSPDEMPHWSNFDPRPIDCATGDVEAMRRVMNTITEDDWNELRVGLKQVPQPFCCGLYHIATSE